MYHLFTPTMYTTLVCCAGWTVHQVSSPVQTASSVPCTVLSISSTLTFPILSRPRARICQFFEPHVVISSFSTSKKGIPVQIFLLLWLLWLCDHHYYYRFFMTARASIFNLLGDGSNKSLDVNRPHKSYCVSSQTININYKGRSHFCLEPVKVQHKKWRCHDYLLLSTLGWIRRDAPIHVLLNKLDLFEEMIKEVPLSTCFKEYDGPDDAALPAISFIKGEHGYYLRCNFLENDKIGAW